MNPVWHRIPAVWLLMCVCLAPASQAFGRSPISASGPTATAAAAVRVGRAPVSEFYLAPVAGQPNHFTLTVRGAVPEPCVKVTRIAQTVTGETIRIDVFTERPLDKMCIQVFTPFEKSFPLDFSALPEGEYIVEVNGLKKTLQLESQ